MTSGWARWMVAAAVGWTLTAPASAGCKVETAVDPVHGVTSRAVQLGRVSPGVYAVVASNDKPSEAFPEHVLALGIQRAGDVELAIRKGDPAVLVLESGARLDTVAFADAVRSTGVTDTQVVSTWSVSYALTREQLTACRRPPSTASWSCLRPALAVSPPR